MNEIRQNDDALFAALKKAKKKKRVRRWITALVIVAVITVGLMVLVSTLRKKVEASMAVEGDEILTFDTTYGSISTRVSGSGTIEDVDTETVTVPEGVEIDEVLVHSNTKLEKDDVIATLDLTSVLNAMATLQEDIDGMDEELAQAGNDRVNSLVTAGVTGRLKKIYVQPQTDVAACMVENGALALISLDGKMAVEIQNDSLNAGDRVKVERADGSMMDGNVEKTVGRTSTVLISDNGPELDEHVQVLTEDGKRLGSGDLFIHNLFRVTGFTGTVASVTSRENMQVYASSTICSLKDTGYTAHYNSILKQRREKEDTLLELLDLYQGGALRAPFTGTVLKIDYDENNTAAASTSGSAQSSVGGYSGLYGMSGTSDTAGSNSSVQVNNTEDVEGIAIVTISPDVSMLVNIEVDEADILSLEKGQLAEVTIESVSRDAFSGIVTDVDKTASSSAGVTNYSAEITFAKGKGMLSGMTADVMINIQGSENVLIVPTEAVQKTSAGAFVYTAYDEETKQFGGILPIEVGISNDDYTEIRSGLDEGTTVYYTEKQQLDFFMMMGGPGMGSRPSSGFRN